MIEANNVCTEAASHSDAGQGFKGYCPKCRDEINVAEMQWWESKCSCGYVWYLSLKIITDDEGRMYVEN